MADPHAAYVKTPKGLEEIERKVHGLHLKARQVLIMIDGKRDLAALQGIFPPEMVPPVLDELLSEGYIRALETPKKPPAPKAAASAAPAAVAELDGEDPFDLAQTFMINIARKILGIAGDEIIVRVEKAKGIQALHALYPDWRRAVVAAPDGLMRIKEFEFKLFQVMGDPTATAGSASAAKAAPKNPPATDQDRLELARNFMINTARNYLGIVADAIVPKLEAAGSLNDLRALFFEWREALRQNPDAKRRLAEYESRLAALLS